MLSTIEELCAGTRVSLSFRPISRASHLHRNDDQRKARSWVKKKYQIHSQYDLAQAQYPREYPSQFQKSVSMVVWRPANTGVWSAGGVFRPAHFFNTIPISLIACL